jgi:hypothetical protein
VSILSGPEWEKEPSIPENDQRNKVFPASTLRFTVYNAKQVSIKKEFNNSSVFLYIKPPNPNA